MNVTSDPLVYVQTRIVFERTLTYDFKILKLCHPRERPSTFVVNVLRSVEVALVVLPAHRADPRANLEILEFWVLVTTRVAELARREKSGLRTRSACRNDAPNTLAF